ncbi:MAG: hypothetical protein KGD65_08710 [Candidatus Lokiarchaeota archaeon]|nr:hypothetical protein [Candidatus Lokiarchaeota archaeon]
MPIGLIIMKWDDRAGTEILAKYPKEIVLTEKTLMQVYSTHEYSGESGMISLMIGSLNIASYYTGPEKNFYILLLLNLDDDPDAYEEGLVDISRTILRYIDEDASLQMIPTLFRRLSVYPTLSDEQRLALTYQDEIKRMIIDRLRDEGVVSKSELMIWLKDKYKQGFIDVEGVLLELIKREIVKEASVKGISSEFVFLIKDILIMRVPPVKILQDPADRGLPSQLVENYKADAKRFFQNYQPTEGDNLRVLDILTNPQVYETLRILRTSVVTKNELKKLKKKGVEDLDDVLKILWDTQMVQVFQGERGNEYYALLSDFHLKLIFPKYLMNTIKTVYDQKSKADQVLIEYLTVLENTYTSLKATAKAKAKIED